MRHCHLSLITHKRIPMHIRQILFAKRCIRTCTTAMNAPSQEALVQIPNLKETLPTDVQCTYIYYTV